MPFFTGTGAGFIVSLLFGTSVFPKRKNLAVGNHWIRIGDSCFSLLGIEETIGISSVLMGLGLGFVMPEFLVIFVKLSHHCQRGTANTTHLLASEIGIALGIAASCDMNTDEMLFIGQIVAAIALLFFILITYPYYKKMKVR